MDPKRAQTNGKGSKPARTEPKGPLQKPPGVWGKVAEPQRSGSSGSSSGLPDARVLFASQALVGYTVQVEVGNGAVYEGILHTLNVDRSETGVVLKMAKTVKHPGGISPNEDEAAAKPQSTLVIQPGTFVQLIADNVKLDGGAQAVDDVGTDAAIGRGKGGAFGRELQRWEMPDGESLDDLALHDGPGPQHGWDQFEANRRLFGVETSFKEELYTTKLDKANCTISEAEAARIAAEIERSGAAAGVAGNMHLAEERGLAVDDSGIDEEEKYSAVLREPGDASTSAPVATGKWVPPNRRGAATGPAAAAAGPTAGSGAAPIPIPMDARREAAKVRMALAGAGPRRDRSSPYGTPPGGAGRSPLITSPLIGDRQQLEALDLNPGVPKIDKDVRREFAEFKKQQAATSASTGKAGSDDSSKPGVSASSSRSSLAAALSPVPPAAAAAAMPSSAASQASTTAAPSAVGPAAAGDGSTRAAAAPSDSDAAGSSAAVAKSKLNPFAKEFKLNPTAKEFKPAGPAAAPAAAAPAAPVPAAAAAAPPFVMHPAHGHPHPGHMSHPHAGAIPLAMGMGGPHHPGATAPRMPSGGGGGPRGTGHMRKADGGPMGPGGVMHGGHGPKGAGPMAGPGGSGMMGHMGPMAMGPQGFPGPGQWMPAGQFLPHAQYMPIAGSPQQQMLYMRPGMGMVPAGMVPMVPGMVPYGHMPAGGPGGRPHMYAMVPHGAMGVPPGAMGVPPGAMAVQDGGPGPMPPPDAAGQN